MGYYSADYSMIIGTLDVQDLAPQFIIMFEQLSERSSGPTVIVEAPHGQYQTAALALAGAFMQESDVAALVNDSRVLIIAPDSENPLVTLEHVKRIQQHFRYKTINNTGLIVVIPDAAQLSLAVQNALLKTTEELQFPHHILFGVQHADQLLQTIQSRSQVINLSLKEGTITPEIAHFWNMFLAADVVSRHEIIETHFSKKTKKGQAQREQLEAYIIGIQQLHETYPEVDLRRIEYFRKICHTVNSQMILDSFLFL